MQLLRYPWVGDRMLRSVLIAVAIFSLTFSVATRFCFPATSHGQTLKSVDRRSSEPTRQHLDGDVLRWVAPTASINVMAPTTIEARLTPTGLLLPRQVFSDSLYNRPPPSA
jgi:hypothetical protein